MKIKIKLLLLSVTLAVAVLVLFSIPIHLGIFTTCTDAYGQLTCKVPEPSGSAVAALVGAYLLLKR